MAEERYWVDWSDAAFPQIRRIDAADATGHEIALTFPEAKKEIAGCFRHQIEHARAQLRQLRSLRTWQVT